MLMKQPKSLKRSNQSIEKGLAILLLVLK